MRNMRKFAPYTKFPLYGNIIMCVNMEKLASLILYQCYPNCVCLVTIPWSSLLDTFSSFIPACVNGTPKNFHLCSISAHDKTNPYNNSVKLIRSLHTFIELSLRSVSIGLQYPRLTCCDLPFVFSDRPT